MNSLLVHEQPRKREPTTISGKSTPSHWADAKGSAFVNPWDSWRNHGFTDMIGMLRQGIKFPSPNAATASKITVRQPTWGLASKDSSAEAVQSNAEKIKTTWLGHACFLVELPNRSQPTLAASRGARVLFDPVFSDRCSPSQWVGPKRFTEPPCKIEEIPEVDAVVISHNHYDHLDTHTIQELAKRERKPHFFAPLGNTEYFKCLGIPEDHVHIMDWWDSKRITITQPSSSTTVTMDITCTPAQHFTGRGVLDRFKSLWASWVVEEVPNPNLENVSKEEHGEKGVKVFFGGDTGYRAVKDGQNEDEVPVCPVFKEIGETFGGFDVAMIPIGAYMPRWFMSPIHCAPQDSVLLFKDIRAKKAIGMHWGTWVLTSEDVLEPPKRLAEECKKVGIEDGAFGVCDIGETMFF